jgi:hypothetical protein
LHWQNDQGESLHSSAGYYEQQLTRPTKTDKIIKENHCVSQQAIANKIVILCEQLHVIIADLRYGKLCFWWVPWMLNEEQKQKWIDICQQLLLRYECEGDEFLRTIARHWSQDSSEDVVLSRDA